MLVFVSVAAYFGEAIFTRRDTLKYLVPVYEVHLQKSMNKPWKDSYDWPERCPQEDYSRYKFLFKDYSKVEIKKECADPRYYIGNGKEFGFSQPRIQAAHYFRLGKDAVRIYCFDTLIRKEKCILDYTVHDVFNK